ncbi:hypothetical protein BJY52DRAFT_1247686 [Lactarius psammicola]|nr:hypothetical protein BJY52DRAFT_1247686 [Lactarius psammicola]
MIPFPCSKKHVSAKTGRGRPFVSVFFCVFFNNRCRSVPSQASQHQLRRPSFPPFLPLNTTHNAGPFTFGFSTFCPFCVLCWVRSTILPICTQTLRRKCRLLLRQLSAVHIFLPLPLCLSPYTASFSSVLFLYPLHFALPVTFYSRCISS